MFEGYQLMIYIIFWRHNTPPVTLFCKFYPLFQLEIGGIVSGLAESCPGCG